MKYLILISFIVALLSTSAFAQSSNLNQYTCIVKNNDFFVVDGFVDGGVAFALLDAAASESGWNYISINTSSDYSDSLQAQAAGYLEGYLTSGSISDFRYNFYIATFGSLSVQANLTAWIQSNINYMQSQIQLYKDVDIKTNSQSLYWYHVSLVLDQITSMVQGFNDAVGEQDSIDVVDLFVSNMGGDMLDLIPALAVQGGNSYEVPKTLNELAINSHCTSFIKVNYDLSEVYCGHTTWNLFATMVRTFKSYSFSFSQQSGIVNSNILFSSYPGILSSTDDFYFLENDMVVMETTNQIFNTSLYEVVNPESVLSWIRAIVSNRLSNSPLQWCQTFSNYNSGTYNNQWIVFDYKKFTPYHQLADGALYILEQIPGQIEYADQTLTLRNGYWASFNIPFYVDIFNKSGYPEFAASSSPNVSREVTYATCSRSEIFKRDSNDVYTLDDMMDFMRYNDYTEDPISRDNPSMSICSRFDLLQEDPIPLGGIDSKVISNALKQQRTVVAISGPTTSNGIPAFNWNENPLFQNVAHYGMPNVFDFDWYAISNNSFTPY